MPGRAGVTVLVVLSACFGAVRGSLAAEGALRWSANGEVLAGGGWDSNLFLLVAASPDSPSFHSYRGFFTRVSPTLAGGLGGSGFRLQLRYGADLLQSFGIGRLYIQNAELGLSLPELGPIGLRLAATGGRFDAGQFPSDRFWTWGAIAEASARVLASLRLSAVYEIDRRLYGDPSAILIHDDLAQLGRVRLAYLPRSPLEVGLEADYLSLRSSPVDATLPAADLSRWRGGADAGYTPTPALTLFASLWGGVQQSVAGDRGRQVGGAAAILARVSSAFDLVGRYELLVSRASSSGSATDPTSGADYTRQVVTAGVIGHIPWSPRRVAPGGAAGGAGAEEAPLVAGGRVRFRVRQAGASSVAVVGSWNDWSAERGEQRLEKTRDPDLWERWVDIGPGRHRYRFLVDGRAQRPRDAPEYRADDFGGEDGVLDVGPAEAAR